MGPFSYLRLKLQKMSTEELAVTYAALILHDDGVDVNADKLKALVTAAGVTVQPFWFKLFEKTLQNKNIGDLLMSGGGGGAAAPAAGGAAAAAAGGAAAEPAAAAAAEPAAEEESDEDMGFGLFD